MRAAVAILVAFTLVLGAAAPAGPPPLPWDEYWQRVQETRDLVVQLEGPPPQAGRDPLLAAAGRWEQVTAVLLPDGTPVPLDPSYLCARLRADPPDLAKLRQSLDALLAARDRWPPSGRTGQDVAALQSILARPEFQWAEEQPSPVAEWFQRLLERIAEFFARLLPGSLGGNTPVSLALTLLGALLLVGAIVFVLRRVRAGLVAEAELDQEAVDEAGLTAASALQRAQALASGGDYRAAVRYLYLSSLLLLEERGLLRYDRSLTNREYLRSIAQLPDLVAMLRPVVEVFERVWYGYQPLDEAAYAHYAGWVADLRRQRSAAFSNQPPAISENIASNPIAD
jgi:hypothetical protein